MSRLFKLFISALTAYLLLLNCSGGGVIVNNPCITGIVKFPEGQLAYGTMVIMGRQGLIGIIDTTVNINRGDFSLFLNLRLFDTAYCDVQGRFVFENVIPDDYILVAKSKETGMLAMSNISCPYDQNYEIDLILKTGAELTIKPYYFNNTDTSNFIAAQIAGTGFYATADTNTGLLEFEQVPSGELEIVLFRQNNSKEIFNELVTVSGISSTLMVDPHRNSSFWTVIKPGPREPLGRPYILSSTPSDGARSDSVNQSSDRIFDVEIQFSHPMDSKLTNPAVSVKSSDGLTSLDSIWWQGGNVAYLKFCTIDSSGRCIRGDSLYRSGTVYSVIIDTTASTSLGVSLAYPDTLTFIPKP